MARALAEDVGEGDLTTRITVPPDAHARARITQKAPGIVFGLDLVQETFDSLTRRWNVSAWPRRVSGVTGGL